MKKECKVVMQSTEKAAPIYSIRKDRSRFELIAGMHVIRERPCHNQHLYIISDEEIKRGDHYLFWRVEEPVLAVAHWTIEKSITAKETNRIFGKILASTDMELGLARPSNEFIEAYCRHYNSSGKKISEVLVEYESEREVYNKVTNDGIWVDKLKVAVDNTITILPIEKELLFDNKDMLAAFNKGVEVGMHAQIRPECVRKPIGLGNFNEWLNSYKSE